MSEKCLPCWVYRSVKHQEMYLFLAEEEGFDRVPDALLQRFGDPVPVIELELCSTRKLAREDVNRVIDHLLGQGYHLQLPPQADPDRGQPD